MRARSASYDRCVGWRRPVGLVTLGVATAFAVGAATPGSPTAASSGGTLRVVLPASAAPTLDPAVVSDPMGWGSLWYSTCATLMAFRDAPAPGGFEVRPEAAVGFPKTSHGGRTYLFKVRPGLHFSDGSRLTAANFKYGLQRARNPDMESEAAFLFSDVKRVTTSGRRLRIDLTKPSGSLLTRLALSYACPVPLNFPINAAGVPLTVSSGPYYIADFEPGRQVVLERNPKYDGTRPRRVDRAVIKIGGDFASNVSAVQEGRADLLGAPLPFDLQDSLAKLYGVNRSQLFRFRGTVVYYLALNTSRPLFHNDVALRKAVNLALDRRAIVRTGPGWRYAYAHKATDQIITSWPPGWVDHRLYPLAAPNLKRARSLAAGHLGDGKAILYVNQVPAARLYDQANLIARELGQIRLDVTVVPIPKDPLEAKAGKPGEPYDMVLTRHFLQYPDPADVLIGLLGGANARKPAGNTNFAYFDNARYDRRMAADDRLTGRARARTFSNLDAKIMRNAAPWAPLYEGSNWLFVSKRVGCLKTHPVFRIDLAAVCVH